MEEKEERIRLEEIGVQYSLFGLTPPPYLYTNLKP